MTQNALIYILIYKMNAFKMNAFIYYMQQLEKQNWRWMKLAESLGPPVFLQSFPCSMPVHKITVIIIILVSKKPAKLIEFQLKLLHRRIPTDDLLLKIGRKENDNCTFCNHFLETLIHLFWSCHVTSSFWKSVTDWLQNALPLIGKYNLLNLLHWAWGRSLILPNTRVH